mgnify:CR=1 FL=1
MQDAEAANGVTVQSAFLAPNEYTFYLMTESDTLDGLTALRGPPLSEDHEADVVPVAMFGETLDTLEIE